jgi:hypothetical protein
MEPPPDAADAVSTSGRERWRQEECGRGRIRCGVGPDGSKAKRSVEGMLVTQIVVAHEAALDMYRRAWSQPPEYFEARCRYLQLADKAQRTVALLTERLDRHRGAGQQQITVKHVTVNADNAIVGDVNQAPGVAPSAEIEGLPHALGHASQPALWSENPQRQPLPVAGDAERTLPDAWGTVAGRAEGK